MHSAHEVKACESLSLANRGVAIVHPYRCVWTCQFELHAATRKYSFTADAMLCRRNQLEGWRRHEGCTYGGQLPVQA